MSLCMLLLEATVLLLSVSVLLCAVVILHLYRKNKVLQDRMARYEEIVEGQELLADRIQRLIARLDSPVSRASMCNGCSRM